MCLAWDAAMPFRADVVYILRDFCCVVIAAFLVPDVEPGPVIVAEASRFNVHLPCDSDKLMDRFTEIAFGKEHQNLNIGAIGPRRRSRWAPPPGRDKPSPTTGKPIASPARPPMALASGPKPQRPST